MNTLPIGPENKKQPKLLSFEADTSWIEKITLSWIEKILSLSGVSPVDVDDYSKNIFPFNPNTLSLEQIQSMESDNPLSSDNMTLTQLSADMNIELWEENDNEWISAFKKLLNRDIH